MGRYGYTVVRTDKDDQKKILKVETFCTNRTLATDTCVKLQEQNPEFGFVYVDTDITEPPLTPEEELEQFKEFTKFAKVAENIIEKEDTLQKADIEIVDCDECNGNGFNKPGTGYDAVCDKCGGLGKYPKI